MSAGGPAVIWRRPLVLAALAASLVVVSTAAGAAAEAPTVTVTQSVAGLNDVVSGGFEPPDVTLAAGPGFVVELVNLAARVWRTGGGQPQQAQTLTLASLFQTGDDRLTDPRILFDAPSGRWLASISDVDSKSVVLAVSKSSDPTAGWNTYSFLSAGCADQPRIGVADGIVVLAADVFRSCGEGFSPLLGSQVWVVNKAELVAGAETVDSTSFGPDRKYESLAPVQSLSPTDTEYIVGVDLPSARVVHLLTVDGVPPDAVRMEEGPLLPVSQLLPPPPAQQPHPVGASRSSSIETNDNRVLDSVWENGRLWLSANSGCVPSGDTRPRSCARVIELATATRSVTWDTDIARAGAHIFYPSIRPDGAGNLVVVYGESGVAELPRLLVVGRAPDGAFSSAVTVAQSASPHEGGRFGDYFGAARDPQNPDVVWVAGEYGVDVPGVRGWSTSVASVQVTSAGGLPPATTRALPPGLRAGAASGPVGIAVRLGYTALDDGVAVRERVVVKVNGKAVFNETTSPGRLSATQSYYVLWHPAKRLRGRFTWCVHSIAVSGVTSPDSCATVTLR